MGGPGRKGEPKNRQSRQGLARRGVALLLSLLLSSLFLALPSAIAASSGEGGDGGAVPSDVPSGDASDGAVPSEGVSLPFLRREEKGSLLPGRTLTLTLYACGAPAFGFEGDTVMGETLTLTAAESLLPGWQVYLKEGHFLLCSDTMETPLQTDTPTPVCRFLLRVAEEAVPGSEASFSLSNFTVTDGTLPETPGDPGFSQKIAPPDSTAARLSSLSAGDYPLEPAFSGEIFEYTVRNLPHTLESLPLQYTPAGEDLTVEEDCPPLEDGRTQLTLTVKAPDGSETVYTVTALRAFGDGYLPSSEGRLQSLLPSVGTLSPAFSPEITDYLLYLTAEQAKETLTLLPTPLDELAAAVPVSLLPEQSEAGKSGVTTATLECVAEDGQTLTYTVTVVALPPYEGLPPFVENGRELQGSVKILQTEEGYTLDCLLTRADSRYTVEWRFEGAMQGSGELLPAGDRLRNGLLTAELVGCDGFTGKLLAECYLDGEGKPIDRPAGGALSPMTFLLGGGVALLALLTGFLAGRAAGKRSEKRRRKESGSHTSQK